MRHHSRIIGIMIVFVIISLVTHAPRASASHETELLVARCRAVCAQRHLHPVAVVDEGIVEAAGVEAAAKAETPDEKCHRIPDCQMCWKTCAMIYGNFYVWGRMCMLPKNLCVSNKLLFCLVSLFKICFLFDSSFASVA